MYSGGRRAIRRTSSSWTAARGQLSVAVKVFEELAVGDVDVIAWAKGRTESAVTGEKDRRTGLYASTGRTHYPFAVFAGTFVS